MQGRRERAAILRRHLKLAANGPPLPGPASRVQRPVPSLRRRADVGGMVRCLGDVRSTRIGHRRGQMCSDAVAGRVVAADSQPEGAGISRDRLACAGPARPPILGADATGVHCSTNAPISAFRS